MRLKAGLTSVVVVFSSLCGIGYASEPDLSAYPYPQAGEKIWVIQPPKIDEENLHQVQIVPGQWIEKDCNSYGLGGSIEKQALEGTGQEYYRVTRLGPMISTMMACIDYPKKWTFIPAYDASTSVRYNSREPVVVYAPSDADVKYRVFVTDGELKDAQSARR